MDQLTSKQLSEWEAYDRIDPIGKWRDDFSLAKIESLITNIVQQLYAKKGTIPVNTTPLDFMVDWSGQGKYQIQKQQSVEEQKQILMSWANAQNRQVKKRNTPPVKKTKK